jgi:hypothetical protein
MAAWKNYHEYNLLLHKDSNTSGKTQWFFFSVRSAKKDSTVRFNIINLEKESSLF